MKAYELLLKKGWCQGDYARNENGADVSHTNPKASEYCALGAICCCYEGEERVQAIRRAVMLIPREFHRFRIKPGAIIVGWNDAIGRTRPQVVALLKEANV